MQPKNKEFDDAIEWLYSSGFGVKEIATMLEIKISLVRSTIIRKNIQRQHRVHCPVVDCITGCGRKTTNRGGVCPRCVDKKWYITNRERVSRNWYKYKYGVSKDVLPELLAKQSGRCAICGTDRPGGPHEIWQLDHDHGTNEIRGLLCMPCNVGLGSFKDDTIILSNAIKYLDNHKDFSNL